MDYEAFFPQILNQITDWISSFNPGVAPWQWALGLVMVSLALAAVVRDLLFPLFRFGLAFGVVALGVLVAWRILLGG